MLREDIDGKALLALSEAHFEKLGLSMGHRVKLLALLAKLVGGPDEESDKESPRLGSRNIPIAAYLPLQMQALVVPGTGRALLVSESTRMLSHSRRRGTRPREAWTAPTIVWNRPVRSTSGTRLGVAMSPGRYAKLKAAGV
jgi:hypothetical protein